MDVPIQIQLRQLSRCFPRSPELAITREMRDAYIVYTMEQNRYRYITLSAQFDTPTYGPHRLIVWPED